MQLLDENNYKDQRAVIYDSDSSLERDGPLQAEASDRLSQPISLFGLNKSAIFITVSVVGFVLLLGVAGLVVNSFIAKRTASSTASSQPTAGYSVGNLPLQGLSSTNLAVGQAAQLDINGQLQVNNSFVIKPGAAPTAPTAGQIYFDKGTNQPYFYDGSTFVSLDKSQVDSVGGVTGAITLGDGLQATGNQLSLANSIVQAGKLSAGNGISIAGSAITNSGVTKLGGISGNVATGFGLSTDNGVLQSTIDVTAATGSAISVMPDGKGGFVLDVAAGGGSLILGPAAAQDDVSVGNPSIFINKTGSGNLIQLQSGGVDKFIVDQGGSISLGSIDYSQVTNAPGQLVNTLGGSTGNITLDSATLQIIGGQLSVKSSGTGNFIFNDTALRQGNINLQSLGSSYPTASFTGANSQTANILQVNVDGGGNNHVFAIDANGNAIFQPATDATQSFTIYNADRSTPIFNVDSTTKTVTITGQGNAGSAGHTALNVIGDINVDSLSSYKVNGVAICGQFGCLSSAGAGGGTGILNTYQFDTANRAENVALYSQSDTQATAAIQARPGQVTSNADLLQFRNSTGGRTLSVDTAGALKFWDASTGNTYSSSLTFADPTANTVFVLPSHIGGTRTEQICTDVNNKCSGSGTGIAGSGTAGTLAYFFNSGTLADSAIAQASGANPLVTLTGDLQVTGSGTTGLTLGQGATNGLLTFVAGTKKVTIQPTGGTPVSDSIIKLPTAGGTFAISASGLLSLDTTTGALSCALCASTGGGGSGATAVTTFNSLAGDIVLDNAGTTGQAGHIALNKATVDNAGSPQLGIAMFANGNFTVNGGGVVDTIQPIATTASPQFAGLVVSTGTGPSTKKATINLASGFGTTARTYYVPDSGAATPTFALSASAPLALSTSTGNLTLNGTIAVANGGTGLTTYAKGDIAYASASNTLSNLAISGTAGLCLIVGSGGSAGVPVWGSCAGGSGSGATLQNAYDNYSGTNSALVQLDNTTHKGVVFQNGSGGSAISGSLLTVQNSNGSTKYFDVTPISTTISNLKLGNVSATGILLSDGTGNVSGGTINLATPSTYLTGSLAVTSGGTGQNSYTAGDLLYASGTTTLGKLAAGSTGQCLTISSGTPVWGSCAGTGGSGAVTLQNVYDNSNPAKVTLGSNGALTLNQGTIATGSNNLFLIQTAGNADLFKVDANGLTTATGNLTVAGAGALTAVSGVFSSGTASNSLTLGTIGSQNGSIVFRSSAAASGTTTLKQTTSKTGTAQTITLPDATGTICLDTNNCSIAAGSNNYIQNQTSSAQTAGFWINGSAEIDTTLFTPLVSALAAASGAGNNLTVQASNAVSGTTAGGSTTVKAGTGFGAGSGGAVSITGGAGGVTGSGGNVTISGGAKSASGSAGSVIIKAQTGNDSTTAFMVQNASSQAIVTTDTTNGQLILGLSGTAFGGKLQFAGSTSGTITLSAPSSVTSYSLTLPTAAPSTSQCLLSGAVTASQLTFGSCSQAHGKKILLTAEYAGAVLDAGTLGNNNGTMVAGNDLTNRENYYKWTTTQSTSQSYDVDVQVPIPNDFASWASSTPLSFDVYTGDTTNSTIQAELRDTTNSVEGNVNFASITPTANSTWQTKVAGTVTGTYTAGGYLTLRIRLYANSTVPSDGVRVGNITLNYTSSY